MVSCKVACTIFAAVASAIAAHALPSSFPKVTHERRDVVQGQWTKISRAEVGAPLTLRIGLKQRNLERADEFMDAISNPSSETYGQHWSPQKVAEMFAPSDEAITETEEWLLSEGVTSEQISKTSGRNWIKVSTTIGKAESLLGATYNVYENEDGVQLVACESYNVPVAIQGHIDLVAPTIQFDEREARVITRRGIEKRDQGNGGRWKKLPPQGPPYGRRPDELKNCSVATTPACLRAL